MLINDKYINSFVSSLKNKHLNETEFDEEYHSLKIKVYILNRNNIICMEKFNYHRDCIFFHPRIFAVSNDTNKIVMVQKTDGVLLKDIKFSELNLAKKILISLRFISLLEYVKKENILYSLDNVFVNKNIELSIKNELYKGNKISNKVLLTQSNSPISNDNDYMSDFVFIFKKMFSFMNISLFFNAIPDNENKFKEIRKVIFNIFLIAIQIDKI